MLGRVFRPTALAPGWMGLCNKCRQAPSLGTDSWCVGCSAQENVYEELRSRWGSSDLRRAANDLLVDAARQVKVLRALSLRLQPIVPPGLEAGRKEGAPARGATAKALALPAKQPVENEKVAEPEPEGSYSHTYSECEEEDAIEEELTPSRKPPPRTPPIPPPVVKKEEEVESPERKKRDREEKKSKAASSHKKKKERVKSDRDRHRGRRGGRKHQQVHRRKSDPGVRFHKKRGVRELKRLREEDFSDIPTPPPCPR